MSCYRPNYYVDGRFVGREYYDRLTPAEKLIAVPIPCGNCLACQNDKAEEWAYRVMSEYDGTGMVLTLTYDDEHLPAGGCLCRKDTQDFLKRLRERIEPTKVRYFGCGEYGTNGTHRPHYHIVVLGYQYPDLEYWKYTKKGTQLYKSRLSDTVWKNGITSVATVTRESVKYSCKYFQKLFPCPAEVAPFTFMSTHPGFGAHEALEKVENDSIYIDGQRRKCPRYYLKLADKAGIDVEQIKERRKATAKIFEELIPAETLRLRNEQAIEKEMQLSRQLFKNAENL